MHQVPDQDSTAVVADAAAASARGSNPEERASSSGGLGKRARVPSARAQAAAEQAQEDAVAEDEHADTAPEAPSDNSTAMASRGAADEVESDARFSGCAALMAAAEATALADVGESQHDQSSSAGPSGNGSGNSNQRERERPAPFLSKLMQIMETDAQPGGIVYWAETSGEGDASSTSADAQAQAPGGDGSTVSAPAFVISDTATFAKLILPRYFKHNKLSSFIQQLYTYGFRRVPCPDLRQQQQTAAAPATEPPMPTQTISFQHNLFRADAPHLLLQIRRNTSSGGSGSTGGAHVNQSMPVAQGYPGAASCASMSSVRCASGLRARASRYFGRVGGAGSLDSTCSLHYDLEGGHHSMGHHCGLGGTPGSGTIGQTSADAVAELLSEVETLEETINALKRMQNERHSTDARWLEEMMYTVQQTILDRTASRPSASAASMGSTVSSSTERPTRSTIAPHMSTSAVPPASLSSSHLASLHQRLLAGDSLGELLGSRGIRNGVGVDGSHSGSLGGLGVLWVAAWTARVFSAAWPRKHSWELVNGRRGPMSGLSSGLTADLMA